MFSFAVIGFDIDTRYSDYIGKALVLDTPMGNIAKNLMSAGASLGVSSRGLGSLKECNGYLEVQEDFMLSTAADIVADPSAPDAWVSSIMENNEWVFDERNGWQAVSIAEQTRKEAKKKKLMAEQKLSAFKKFLSSLK